MEFDYRAGDDSGLMYSGDYEPGTRLSQTIEPGDEVTLKVGGSRINVVVDTVNGGSYEGTVSRFIDDPDAFDSLEVGDDVEFSHSNIWARHRSL